MLYQITCFTSHLKKPSTNEQDYCKEILIKTPIFFLMFVLFLSEKDFPLLQIDHNHFHYIAAM